MRSAKKAAVRRRIATRNPMRYSDTVVLPETTYARSSHHNEQQASLEWQKRLELAQAAGLRIGLWDWDLINNTVVWSEESCRQFGFTLDSFSGNVEDATKRIHPEDWPRVEAAIHQVLEGKQTYAAEYRTIWPDGSTCWIDAHGVVVGNGSKRMLGIGIDITERKNNEQCLQLAQLELARMSRIATMGELTTSIAHEINQPLAAASANASAALNWLETKPPAREETKKALASTLRELNRASAVITRVRALVNREQLQKKLLNVSEIVGDVLTLMESELLQAAVAVRTDLKANLPSVSGDAIQLQQLVMNLVLNALESMRLTNRPRKLFIKAEGSPEGVLTSIQDSGSGIDPENLKHIFESFFTTKPQGIGMGLSLSRSIVEAHRGRIWATRASPFGVVFHFLLPRSSD